MNPLQLVLIAVRGLSLLTNNPALGGGSNLKLQQTSKLLDFLGELLERGDEAHTELKEFAETIQRMVDENRQPTPTEWAALQARSDAAHDVIQDARRRAEEEEVANQPDPEPEPEPDPTPAEDTLPDDDESPVVDPNQ